MANPGRLDVDWRAVRIDYDVGQFSIRTLGLKHGVSHRAIRKRQSIADSMALCDALTRLLGPLSRPPLRRPSRRSARPPPPLRSWCVAATG
jgi:hypothetical protein